MRHVGHILGQVQVGPENFNVEPGRVVRLRPGWAANRLILRIMEIESK